MAREEQTGKERVAKMEEEEEKEREPQTERDTGMVKRAMAIKGKQNLFEYGWIGSSIGK